MPTLTTVADWTITAAEETARFTHAAGAEYWAPRVWNGHGLGIAATDVAAFDRALSETMKLPVYWRARTRHAGSRAGDPGVWAEPRYEPDDDFVFVSGPCRSAEPAPGYRPVSAFDIDLVHLRGLRIRIAAYRSASRAGA
ncbi:hypothetical protein [Amycolatopsis azurea]|uniref:Uncharacterized protein n=1 Tax=Amycolatopsis azurea DSM 43854 TaxID=1238180 RepID=M2QDR3_9PSEU|nr:hypothetical protein [Amycolatopsis azurea]EMD24212.1 hypothetical protein C791_6290 [Amycolatopsis azurea DSM 43854]OOC07966.1 hypothetical protein B0293_03510 [Amycolatopsis azurea DSM 43854]